MQQPPTGEAGLLDFFQPHSPTPTHLQSQTTILSIPPAHHKGIPTSTVFILCLYEIYSPCNQLLIQAAAKILLLGNNEQLPVAYKPQVTVKHKILKTCCHFLSLYTFFSFRDTRVVFVSMLIYDGLCYAAPI